jgi:hypothetical protein
MTLQDAIDHYGSQAALARALNREPAAITNWKARGGVIPLDVQYRLQVITEGRLKADQPDTKPAA